jgi:tetratricopeptide (TPR) repeat protein
MRGEREATPVADRVFNSASLLPSDTMPRVLRDELEGIDFYIAQGYVEIARDTLDRLRQENGDHFEIMVRYKRLGGEDDLPAAESAEPEPRAHISVEPAQVADYALSPPDLPTPVVDEETVEMAGTEFEITVADDDGLPSPEPIEEPLPEPEPVAVSHEPVFIQKESGPLYPDLVVQLNTSDLQRHASTLDAFEALTSPPVTHERVGTGDLIESIVSSIDSSFDAIHQPGHGSFFDKSHAPVEPFPDYHSVHLDEEHLAAAPPVTEDVGFNGDAIVAMSFESRPFDTGSFADDELPEIIPLAAAEDSEMVHDSMSARDELQEIFDELKEKTGDLRPFIDFETHYSLGLAYKDMELLDDAISEFQMAFRMAGIEDLQGDYIHCCNMLGVCFKRKEMHKVAIMWFERGLKIPGRLEDEYQALRFEIGLCYEEMGEIDLAVNAFTDVYAIDVNYRKVGDKINQLRGGKGVA